MKKSKFTESQIVAILKEADAGMKVADVCRNHGISQPTYYNWKSRYGGLGISELKRIREIEVEHSKLKRMYADLVYCQPSDLHKLTVLFRIRSAVAVQTNGDESSLWAFR